MQADKNTVIGMILLVLLFFAYFYFSNKQQEAIALANKKNEDSISFVRAKQLKTQDAAHRLESLHKDSISRVLSAGDFAANATGIEKIFTFQNDDLKVSFSNRGGNVRRVELRKFNSNFANKPVELSSDSANALSYDISVTDKSRLSVDSLYFSDPIVTKKESGATLIEFNILSKDGNSLKHQFTLPKSGYLIDWSVCASGANNLFNNNQLVVKWNLRTHQLEKSSLYEKQMSNICFKDKDGFDYIFFKIFSCF